MTEEFGLRATLPAPPAPVFHALTDPGTMRGWLAEHTEVSLAEEQYEFWGRTTPQGEPGRQRLLATGRHTMHTFWPMAIGNLSELLAGRDGITGCDFSEARASEIRIQLTIPAPAAQVFASITDPATVKKWWGYAPEIEPRVGGKVTFGAEGRVSEWEPGRVFAYAEEGMITRWELADRWDHHAHVCPKWIRGGRAGQRGTARGRLVRRVA